MDIETGEGVPVSGGISDLSGADGKTTFYSGGITLTASEGMNFNSGNGLGVGPSNSFRILGNDTVTVKYDSPLTINQVNLWVKNSVEEDVQISATINIDEKEYTVQATAREAGNGGNALSYLTTLKLIDSAGEQVGNEVTSTISNSQLTLNSMIGEKSYTFSITPDFSNGNNDDTIVFESSVAFSEYVISNGPDGKGNGFTIGQIGTDTSTPLFYEYPVALEALSTDDSGNVEDLNSSFTIGGLKTGDSIVFGDNIFEAGDDGTITINSADLFNEISSDSDELTLRSSEELPEGYKLSLTVSSTENGQVMITSKGGSADDSFTGGDYADLLSGGAGNDTFTGGLGDDVFAWNLADADKGNDTITDFGTGADVIDISDLLQNEDGSSASNLLSYIQLSKDGSDTIVKIDADGGSDFENSDQQIKLEGIDLVTGHSDQTAMIDDLLSSGKLIID
ncbi:MAG: Poly(beta-D-mannuronate) C5 epimerase 5 [Marinobacterium sp. xm-d-530]|nr:MAG: Poly(beta-D-mannuronate) C5 epimerase 5 [Marinobacterium sp. xm-d-530]